MGAVHGDAQTGPGDVRAAGVAHETLAPGEQGEASGSGVASAASSQARQMGGLVAMKVRCLFMGASSARREEAVGVGMARAVVFSDQASPLLR